MTNFTYVPHKRFLKKQTSKKKSETIEKSPHDPRQCTVVDILRDKAHHGDVRAMTTLGLYYVYGIGCRKQPYHAACLFENAYSHTKNDSASTYLSRADICLMAGKLIDPEVFGKVNRYFGIEIWVRKQIEDDLLSGALNL